MPFVDAHYRTLPDRAHRAISGKSSGGFGAMITPMLRPDLFGALASHAGDALYELCYLAESASQCATCATMTATSAPGGQTSGLGPRSPSPSTATC
ncbi:MAG TPA: alpha/beta hydrolase-fold protein, partial [Pseudonocardiaceae bacterium]|nr:alpha/beta hydrolase-fold protein [Pseudonocardiaceae bacterium]